MFVNYEKPTELLPLAMWVFEGENGRVLCEDCKSESCYGCPCAWRKNNGQTQYYRQPIFGMAKA